MKSKTSGKGAPLVLVPGGLTGWISWDAFVPIFESDHTVTCVQLLNVDYGLEGKPLPDDYSLAYESRDLAKTINDLGIEKADFVAWSYGAAITLDFALNNPERVRSLTLIEPPAIWVLRNRNLLREVLDGDEETMKELSVDDISENQLAWFSRFAGFVPQSTDPTTVPQWPVWVKHRQSLRNNVVVFDHTDSLERLRNFHIPVLLVTGEGTSLFLAEIIAALGEEFPDARIAKFPGGHAPHLASREEFLIRLKGFLIHGK